MTGKERIKRILAHQPVDRIAVYEHFWVDALKRYIEEGYVRDGELLEDHFGLDLQTYWAFNMVADFRKEPVVIAETEDTVTTLDGNGAYLRNHKKHQSTPEHVDFTVKEKKDWDKIKHLLMEPDEGRIDFAQYRKMKQAAADAQRFFVWSGVNVFECMHPLCGHENLLVGMALEPEWILEMGQTYADLIIALQKILFEKEGYPDGIWYYEDMGFKERPFMSPDMYRTLIKPFHQQTIAYAKSVGLPVIMHSCGYVEPLLADMVDAGIDCLQAIEIKAGMDLLRIYREYGDRIALMGGLDVRCMFGNNRAEIDAELESKIPIVKEGYGYILHSDHSIPNTVDHDTYRYFVQKGLELGTY